MPVLRKPRPSKTHKFREPLEGELAKIWQYLQRLILGPTWNLDNYQRKQVRLQKWNVVTKQYDDVFRVDNKNWKDLRIVPGVFQLAGAADPSIQPWQPGGAGATFQVYKFLVNDEVFFTCQMPHSYKEGTSVYAHLHWTPCNRGVAEAGNAVDWALDYAWANQGDVFPSSGTVSLLDNCDGANDKHELSPSAEIDGTGKKISSMLVCRLYRSGVSDTWVSVLAAQSPALLEFDLHFEQNSIGSLEELDKEP